MSDDEIVNDVAEGFSSEEEDDVIEFEEQEESEMDHDPMDDPQECCGCKLSCSRRSIRKVLGLTLVALAAFMFSLVTLGVKTSIHGGMLFCGVLVFRGGVSWFINLAVMIFRRFPISQMMGTKMKVPLLLLLGFFGAFAQLFAFYAVSVLSMADANVYMMTSPVFVFLLARVWLGDPVDYVDVISAVVCITGVIFVSKPSAIFGCDETDDCGLTQYCDMDGTCSECGDDLDENPMLLTTMTMENFTAYEICRGVEALTDTSLVELGGEMSVAGPMFCDVSWGMEVEVTTPETENNCHYECLHTTDCGFFTSGWVGTSMRCLLYMGESCNTTNVMGSVSGMTGQTFTDLETHPPQLFRMLGEYREADNSAKGLAICMAILSALAAAVTYCVIRKIGHGIDGLVCVNYFAFISTIVALIGGAFQQIPLPNHPEVWGAVIGMGVAGFLGQYMLTVGFQLEKPGPASVIRYCDVIFVFIWDAAFFDTTPGWNNYVGALLVIAAAVGIVMNKTRKEKLGIKQQKPLINFGDCACCCRPQEGDDGGGEIAHDDPSLKKLKAKAHTTSGKKSKAVAQAYVTDVEIDTAQVEENPKQEDEADDGLDEMESTV